MIAQPESSTEIVLRTAWASAARRLAARAPPPYGELIELRGDEALSVFRSARNAVWAAVDLQRRFRERIDAEPALLLGVGIGLDAGGGGSYRGRLSRACPERRRAPL